MFQLVNNRCFSWTKQPLGGGFGRRKAPWTHRQRSAPQGSFWCTSGAIHTPCKHRTSRLGSVYQLPFLPVVTPRLSGKTAGGKLTIKGHSGRQAGTHLRRGRQTRLVDGTWLLPPPPPPPPPSPTRGQTGAPPKPPEGVRRLRGREVTGQEPDSPHRSPPRCRLGSVPWLPLLRRAAAAAPPLSAVGDGEGNHPGVRAGEAAGQAAAGGGRTGKPSRCAARGVEWGGLGEPKGAPWACVRRGRPEGGRERAVSVASPCERPCRARRLVRAEGFGCGGESHGSVLFSEAWKS